jgi:single-strand DNA-binding protein
VQPQELARERVAFQRLVNSGRRIPWNKAGTSARALLYVDNRRLAEGSLSRRALPAYRVAPDVRKWTQTSEQSDRSRIEGDQHQRLGPGIFAGNIEWRAVMAGSVNKVILIGNLGKDPEIRRTQDGRPIANLTLATSETWRDKNSGERKEKTEWHRVVIFSEPLCKIVEQYLKKGAKIYVEGALQTRKWTDNAGVEKYSTEVVLQGFNSVLTMLDGRSGGGSSGGGGGSFGSDDGGDFGSSSPSSSAPRRPVVAGGGGRNNDMDDDIPF